MPRGLTLLEVVIAMALLLVIVLGFAAMATISLRTTREARPTFVVQETAMRIIERMRSDQKGIAFNHYWADAAVTKVTLGGVDWAVGRSDGANTAFNNAIAPLHPNNPVPAVLAGQGDYFAALTGGLLRQPSDDPHLVRIRFLNETQYQQVWGLAVVPDLDFNSVFDAGNTSPNIAYGMFPVVVEVRWRDQDNVDRMYQVKTVLVDQVPMDPAAPTGS